MPDPQDLPSDLPQFPQFPTSSHPATPLLDPSSPIFSTTASAALSQIPVLRLETQYLYSPFEELASLPAPKLLEALLSRILVGGIGRLFFQRAEKQGRILWSQNGVLQSVLNGLNPMLLQGVLDELKHLFQLPPTPVLKTKQVEIERLYQQTRLLLRLQILPSVQGEEATLQVLRGAALKFRQQQQLSSLSQDAIKAALDLQRQIEEIRTRVDANAPAQDELVNVLPILRQIADKINSQLDDLSNILAERS
jgi:hypothetical protein